MRIVVWVDVSQVHWGQPCIWPPGLKAWWGRNDRLKHQSQVISYRGVPTETCCWLDTEPGLLLSGWPFKNSTGNNGVTYHIEAGIAEHGLTRARHQPLPQSFSLVWGGKCPIYEYKVSALRCSFPQWLLFKNANGINDTCGVSLYKLSEPSENIKIQISPRLAASK